MSEVSNLNDRRPSVHYTVNVEHRWDGSLVFSIDGLGDDPDGRSREAVVYALRSLISIIEGHRAEE